MKEGPKWEETTSVAVVGATQIWWRTWHMLFNSNGARDQIFSLALAGMHGGQINILKPFETLSTSQLQAELRQRNVFHSATNKKDCYAILAQTLMGVQRVPTLLLSFTISKPIKLASRKLWNTGFWPTSWHQRTLSPPIYWAPILDKETGELCHQIVSQYTKKEKITCADLRLTVILLYACLLKRLTSDD